MRILVLDTSTERGIVACFDENKLIFSVELPVGLQNSKFLLSELEKQLGTKIKMQSLECIAVGIGPGSYTGIRVGTIVAKTLAFALQIPLIGICTLDAFVPDHDCTFGVVIDAKIGGAYLQKGKLHEGVITTEMPQVLPLQQAADHLKGCEVLITPYAEHLRPKLEAFLESSPAWQERYPSSLRLASLGLNKFRAGDFSKDGHLELLYMRKTQAEMERGKS